MKFNKLTSPVLTGKLFGATIEMSATGFDCVGCTAENKEVGGVMEVAGTGGKLTSTGVKVVGLEEKCEVVGTAAEDITTKEVKFTTAANTGATLEPVTGTLFAEFEIKAKAGKECSVAGKGLKISGKTPATFNGAKLSVNVTKASEQLLLEGEKASLKLEATMEDGGTHPISLTTA